jgi:drug/metabolite transporter (DMT)-like permease
MAGERAAGGMMDESDGDERRRPRAATRAIGFALTAALLFGFSTPAAKLALARADPWLTAGLLYLGSGVGLGGFWLLQRALGRRAREAPLRPADLPWLAAAILAGGGVAPVLLMFGLAEGSAGQASLLLNAEGILTVLVAWWVFGEHVDRRIASGMALITIGALVVAWQPGAEMERGRPALLVVGACLAWAVDNNLTRRVSGGDPMLIAAIKGAAAGTANLAVAVASGEPLPDAGAIVTTALVGLVGYGVSLVLFVRALRELGAARTSAYFSTAPFLGAVAAIAILREPFTASLAVGGALMAVGVWLHVSEQHAHEHVHEPLTHTHLHEHDIHHRHAHEAGTPGGEPHVHAHTHAPLRHAHPHYPDLHHRHEHEHDV